jgi:hypothetical protein
LIPEFKNWILLKRVFPIFIIFGQRGVGVPVVSGVGVEVGVPVLVEVGVRVAVAVCAQALSERVPINPTMARIKVS